MSKKADQLREKLLKNPPKGMTAREIRRMSDEAIMDMDYFIQKVHDFKMDDSDDYGDEFDDSYGHRYRSGRNDYYDDGYDNEDDYDNY